MKVLIRCIPITVSIDAEDLHILQSHKWTYDGNGYVMTQAEPRISLHRLIIKCVDKSLEVDHIDGNIYNNRKSNLRICTSYQNSLNQGKKYGHIFKQSNYKGVFWAKAHAKWRTCITFNKKKTHIGMFTREIDAAKAYDVKAKELHKEFARLNFPI